MGFARHLVAFSTLTLLLGTEASAQTRPSSWLLGVRGGGSLWFSDWNKSSVGASADVLLRYNAGGGFGLGLLAGFEELKAGQYPTIFSAAYKVRINYVKLVSFPVSVLAMYSLGSGTFSPYLYLGVGGMGYKRSINTQTFPADDAMQFSALVPAGLGLEIPLGRQSAVAMELGTRSVGDWLDARTEGSLDSYLTLKAGIHFFLGNSDNSDDDQDGLTNGEEARLGTDPGVPDTDNDGASDAEEIRVYKTNPSNPDTDGDSLPDGEEAFKYHTDPTRADTDGDGLTDAEEEIRFRTDPLKPDTDGDGLTDSEEMRKFTTNPLKADTDGDELSDGDEVVVNKTDPNKQDSDGDDLDDGEEVKRYKTNPLRADTDGGGISDGMEVRRVSNPLNPRDDQPGQGAADRPGQTQEQGQTLKLVSGKSIVLEGLVFDQSGVRLAPESDALLERVLRALRENPAIRVEIAGYSDNRGSVLRNDVFSQRRADAVKTWLIVRGIPASRLTSVGLGAREPIAPNTSEAGRAKNRRVELHVK